MNSDSLADVIAEAVLRPVDEERPYLERAAEAVRAAGYKSPKEIAAVLDAEEAKYNKDRPCDLDCRVAISRLRVALLGAEKKK